MIEFEDVCFWSGKYGVQIPNQTHITRVASDSVPFQTWSLSLGAMLRRWATHTRSTRKHGDGSGGQGGAVAPLDFQTWYKYSR